MVVGSVVMFGSYLKENEYPDRIPGFIIIALDGLYPVFALCTYPHFPRAISRLKDRKK
jgi:hypothetical protein